MMARTHTVAGLALATGLSLALVAGPARALAPHVRDGWVLGVAVGTGQGEVAFRSGDEGDRVESGSLRGVVPQFRIGHAIIADRLVVSLENKQWLYEQGVLAEEKLRVNVQNWSLGLTYYPADPRSLAGGLFLQAGVGAANARLTLLEPLEDDPWGNRFEEIFLEDESGAAYTFSAGFEFRLVPNVAAGLAASYVYQTIDGDLVDDASSLPVNFILNWYW
jgi:opacity protein-like surface antigen